MSNGRFRLPLLIRVPRTPLIHARALYVLLLAISLTACARPSVQREPVSGPSSNHPIASPPPLAATARPTLKVAYGRAPITPRPTRLHPSQLPKYHRYAPVGPTAWTRGVNPPPISTPRPTAIPKGVPAGVGWPSPLVVDSARGRVYDADVQGSASELSTYSADTGRLIRNVPLLPGEVLLDVGESGEIYVLGSTGSSILDTTWHIRVLDSDGDEQRTLPIPTPNWADPAFQPPNFPLNPAFPILDRSRGRILAFSGPRVTVSDMETGVVTGEFEIPPAGTHGSVVRAALDDSADTLYLALADPGLVDWAGSPGVRLMALAWPDLEVLDRSELRAGLITWIPTGDGVIASGYSYKMRGTDQRVWNMGREVARRTEAGTWWSGYDRKRHRVIGSDTPYDYDSVIGMVVADGERLDLQDVLANPPDLDPVEGGLTAYDPKTDQFYGRSREPDELVAMPASAGGPRPATRSREVDAQVTPNSFIWARERTGPPALTVGSYVRPPRLGEPTAYPDNPSYARAFSSDGGETWQEPDSPRRTAWPWPDGVVASPGFENDRTLFGYKPGLGVFRSSDGGQSWEPSSRGLGALHVREVVLSPDYPSDGTLIAVAEDSYRDDGAGASAWISEDRGDSWSPMGNFTTVAFSPDYARDNRVLAFDTDRFHVSLDGAQSWRHGGVLSGTRRGGDVAGRLWVIPATEDRPEVLLALGTNSSDVGGDAHWNESGAHVFRSVDGGLTWTTNETAFTRSGYDGHLIGPVGDAQSAVWVVSIEGWPPWAVLSRDGGLTWNEVSIEGEPEALILAETEAGQLQVWDPSAGVSTIGLESLESVPTATPYR